MSTLASLVARMCKNKNAADALVACVAAWTRETVPDNASLAAVGAAVCRLLQQRGRGTSAALPQSVWLTTTRQLCVALGHATKTARFAWEQGALQSVTGALVKLFEWHGTACATEILRCLSRILFERGHMLGNHLQDAVMALALPRASVRTALGARTAADVEASDAPEDDRDGSAAATATAAKSGFSSLSECASALLCINAMLSKVKRKSHFADTHLPAIAAVVLGNASVLQDMVMAAGVGANRAATRALSCNLTLLESLISVGAPSVPLYQGRVQGLLASLALLLFSSGGTAGAGRTSGAAAAGPDASLTATDDSDSKSDGAALVDRMRVHVLLVVLAMATNCYTSFVTDISLFLPYGGVTLSSPSSSVASPSSASLYALLVYDSNPRIRMHAILLLTAILKPGKRFFAAAQDAGAGANASFISLSFKLALTLRDIHALLTVALRTEEDESNRTHLLRLFPVLVSVTPYERLVSPLPPRPWSVALERSAEETLLLLAPLRQLQLGRVWNVACIASVLRASRAYVAEIDYWLWRDNVARAVHAMLERAAVSEVEPVVACLGEIATRYAHVLHDVMLCDGMLERLLALPIECAVQCVCDFACAANLNGTQWQRILALALPRAVQPTAALVTLLSRVPAEAWPDLPPALQLTVVATVTGAFEEEADLTVQLASVRGVGHMLLVSPLVTSNVRFLLDAKALLHSASRTGDATLCAAGYWGLGNLAHALVITCNDAASGLDVADARDLMLELLQWSGGGSSSHDEKVVCSCLRIIGKAAQLLAVEQWDGHAERCWQQLSDALVAPGPPKVRWNAASAIAQYLRGSPATLLTPAMRSSMGAALLRVLQTSGNFKERIAAIDALDAAAASSGALLLPSEEVAVHVLRLALAPSEGPRSVEYEERRTTLLRTALDGVTGSQERDRVRAHVAQLQRESPYHVHAMADLVGTGREWVLE